MELHPLIELLIVLAMGIAIIFTATYLVGFAIVKLKKVKKSNLMTIIGFIILIVGSISLLFSNDKQQLITCFVGISFIIEGAFLNKSYYNKTYYLSSLALLILLGVIIIYLAFFKHYLDNIYFIYGIMGMIVLGIIMLVRSYLRRHENQKIQWKNEW